MLLLNFLFYIKIRCDMFNWCIKMINFSPFHLLSQNTGLNQPKGCTYDFTVLAVKARGKMPGNNWFVFQLKSLTISFWHISVIKK